MAVQEVWRSRRYDASKVEARFVEFTRGGGFVWIETQRFGLLKRTRLDVRGGTCRPSDLPVAVMDAALDRRAAGVWPFWVEWPL